MDASEEELGALLASTETRELVRDLYVFNVGSMPDGVTKAREAFTLYCQQAAPALAPVAGDVFDVLLGAADAVLHVAVSGGDLLAQDSRSALRQRLVLDHLHALDRKLECLTSPHASLEEIARFEQEFRAEAAERFGYITPPDFHSAPRVPIDELYVLPSLEARSARQEESEEEPLSYIDWLQTVDRCVVLGNPGAGKSTLAKKICFDLSRSANPGLLAGRQITPVIITLKDYGADKRAHGHSVREFLEERARSSLQFEVPDGAFEYLLAMGRLLVIFDGLDELLDTSYRQEIREDVESFGRRYPSLPVIVTSREVGYAQAPLDPRVYRATRIRDFDDERVTSYAEKWFRLDGDLMPGEQEAKAENFVLESSVVPDLRRNPLLLALMCNLYRGQNYIPRNRPDVYESCARMLFEVWDKSRGIEAVLPIAEHLRPAMQYLASWIYSDDSLRAGVTREQLIEKSTEFLLDWRFDDPHVARHAAGEFVDFCRGRAWVFSDLGSTESGADLFQFTHRTFLEYFAAADLVETYASTRELFDILVPHIARQEWDVVAQVAFQMRTRVARGSGDELLAALLDAAREGDLETRVNCLQFAGRALDFMVPKPKTIREVVGEVLRCAIDCLGEGERAREAGIPRPRFAASEMPSGDLITSVAEIKSEIADDVRGAINTTLDEALVLEDGSAPGAARIVLAFERYPGNLGKDSEDAPASLAESRRARIESLGHESRSLMIDLVGAGHGSMAELLGRFGAGAAFEMRLAIPGRGWYFPVAVTDANTIAYPHPAQNAEAVQAALTGMRELARYLRSAELPWVRGGEHFPPPWSHRVHDPDRTAVPELDDDVRLGLFAVAATCVELTAGRPGVAVAPLTEAASPVWRAVGRLLQADEDAGAVQDEDRMLLSESDMEAFITPWLARTLTFVAEG